MLLGMTQFNEDLVTIKVRACIEEILNDLEFKDYTISISAGAVKGDNYLGVIAKVQVNGVDKSNKNITLNLITKSAPHATVFRTVMPIRMAYDREIYVYRKVIPQFCKFQEEMGILQPFKSYAKYYSSSMDDMNEAVIMEDIKMLGFELRDRRYSLDYNHCLLVMREYGKLHALSFALRDHKPEVFKELADNTHETFFSNMTKLGLDQTLHIQSENALNSLDPIADKEAYDRFKIFKEKMADVVKEIVKAEPAGQYAVIGHGDSWMNNILFKYNNSSNQKCPTELCFLDWQLTRLGSPVLDLSYFIFTCTDKKIRDKHYEHLLQEYYDSLSSFLRKFGSDPEKLFPLYIFKEHLKTFSVFGLYMATVLLFMMTSETEEIPDINKTTDVQDLNDKFHYGTKNYDTFNCRMRDIVLDFLKYGYKF